MKIQKVTPDEILKIIKIREPLGMFYCKNPVGSNGKQYVGIDNKYGEAWTEEFKSLRACKRWLEK